MTSSRPARRAPAASVALVGAIMATLALPGCSGADDGTSAPVQVDGPGPLDEYRAQIYGYAAEDASTESVADDASRTSRMLEETTAACMREQGFDYTPVDYANSVVFSDEALDVDPGSRAFAERYGYGVSTDPWEVAGALDAEWEDPNAAYVAQMSEEEMLVYVETLYGTGGGAEGEEYDWRQAGCYGAATYQVLDGGVDSDQFAGVRDELDRFSETVRADPRTADLDRAWASCMVEAGHVDLTDPAATVDGLLAAWGGITDDAARAEFTADEIALALADLDCQEQVDYVAIAAGIDHELQQEFVDRHRADLDAWAQAASGSRQE